MLDLRWLFVRLLMTAYTSTAGISHRYTLSDDSCSWIPSPTRAMQGFPLGATSVLEGTLPLSLPRWPVDPQATIHRCYFESFVACGSCFPVAVP